MKLGTCCWSKVVHVWGNTCYITLFYLFQNEAEDMLLKHSGEYITKLITKKLDRPRKQRHVKGSFCLCQFVENKVYKVIVWPKVKVTERMQNDCFQRFGCESNSATFYRSAYCKMLSKELFPLLGELVATRAELMQTFPLETAWLCTTNRSHWNCSVQRMVRLKMK